MTNSSRSRFAWLWWLVIFLLLIANLIVLGGLLWLILSDITLSLDLKQSPLAQETLSFAPATSTLPPDATPEEARTLVKVPVSAGSQLALLATLTTQPTLVSPTAAKATTPSSAATPSSTATPSPTQSPEPTATKSPTSTSLPTLTLEPTRTPRPSATSSPAATPTIDLVIAQAGAGSMTIGGAIIVAPNLLPTSTVTPLATESATLTTTPTETIVPSQTSTTVPTGTATASAEPTNTATASAEPTNTATASAEPTNTATASAEPTNTATASAEPTNTAIASAEPTNSPTASVQSTNSPIKPSRTATRSEQSQIPIQRSRTPTNSPTPSPTITLAPATVPPTLLPTQETITQRQADVPTISISVVSNGVLLRWTAIAGEGYRIYSNMGSGLEMYRLLGETETGEWLDTSVESGRTYHYQIIALSDKELSNPIEISITTPQWRWRTIGGATQSRQITEAIATPMATPTLAPLRLTIASRTSYLDSAGDFHVIALLRNQEEGDLVDVAIQINLLNENQEIIQTVSGIPYVQEVASGATIPMHLTIEDVEPKSYTIIATGQPGNASSLPLLIEASQGSEASDGLYYIEGRLRNTGNRRIDFPRIVVVLLDDSGRPVNAAEVRPIPAQIDPDSTATFQMRFDYYPRVVNHEVYALP